MTCSLFSFCPQSAPSGRRGGVGGLSRPKQTPRFPK